MGLSDRLASVRDYLLSALVIAPDHPGRGGMTGEQSSDTADEPTESAAETEDSAGQSETADELRES